MDAGNTLLIASISCGLASVCVVLSLWSFVRLSRVEAKLADLDTKLPPKRIREMEEAFDAMAQAYESLQQRNQEFKQSVHNSVQRLDQVMRRNEKAAERLLDENGNLNPDVVKGEMPDIVKVGHADAAALSKQQALALRYRQNRGG